MPRSETFEQYVVEAARAWAEISLYSYRSDANYRPGQVAFNVLYEDRPDLAVRIRGGNIDPFYDDDALVEFYAWVSENWDN